MTGGRYVSDLTLVRTAIDDSEFTQSKEFGLGVASGVASCKQPQAVHPVWGLGTVVGVDAHGAVLFVPSDTAGPLVTSKAVQICDLSEVPS